jgi:hypothetical protein
MTGNLRGEEILPSSHIKYATILKRGFEVESSSLPGLPESKSNHKHLATAAGQTFTAMEAGPADLASVRNGGGTHELHPYLDVR